MASKLYFAVIDGDPGHFVEAMEESGYSVLPVGGNTVSIITPRDVSSADVAREVYRATESATRVYFIGKKDSDGHLKGDFLRGERPDSFSWAEGSEAIKSVTSSFDW